MRDNQEMATILFNSNLASAEQLNEHWFEITESRDIGQILVDCGILLPKVYTDLLVYIDSLHPETVATVSISEPRAEITSPEDDFIDTDSIIIPSDDYNHVDDLPGGPFDADMSFDDALFDHPEKSTVGEETLHSIVDPSILDGLSDPVARPVATGSKTAAEMLTPEERDEFPDVPSEAFVVDLDDIEPHVDEDVVVEKTMSLVQNDSFFTASADGSLPAKSAIHERIQDVKEKTKSAKKNIAEEKPFSGAALLNTAPGSREIGELKVRIPEAISPRNTLDEILMFARNNGVSDVHLIPDAPITMRRYGALVPVSAEPFPAELIEKALVEGLPKREMEPFHATGDSEFVYTIPGGGRFRVTVMKLRSGCSFTARIIPFTIPSSEEVSLPKSSELLTQWAQGMILVTGPAGCGKSTTLSTLINKINRERNEHIITIENPIETVFPAGQSQICQRQVGMHTLTQENALRGALRQDPDILMVSELRDMESIQLAVSAAETGHLVFGTMNTINASRTIYRLIESFPSDEQDVLRNMISESLRGVISQQLVPKKDGSGVVPVFEVLLITPAVANMIRKNEMHQLMSAMITGRSQGMVLFDDSLMALVKDGTVSAEEAYCRAIDKEPFKALLSKGGE